MTKKGKLFTKNGEEWIEIGGGDENALPKTGGSMTGYLSDKNAGQVRNIIRADSKPPDTTGMDGDVCIIPGASGENVKINQDATGIKINETILQDASTSQDGLMTKELVSAINGKASTSAVQTAQNKANSAYNLASGKLGRSENAVSATKATNDGQNRNIASTYALKSDITSVYKVMGSCTTAQLASKTKNKGDVWNLTDAGQYGAVGTNVVWTGAEWDALGGTIDLSSKLDKSGGSMTSYLTDKSVGQVRNIIQSDVKPTPGDGEDGDIWVCPEDEEVEKGLSIKKTPFNSEQELKTALDSIKGKVGAGPETCVVLTKYDTYDIVLLDSPKPIKFQLIGDYFGTLVFDGGGVISAKVNNVIVTEMKYNAELRYGGLQGGSELYFTLSDLQGYV